ncbi:MAG: hypothetical protein L0312_15870 [Acidobacteria bacterium]|nr:hypothetical protein [Acidobacteriota bacterium]
MLFLCTGNYARSFLAEALVNNIAEPRVSAASARKTESVRVFGVVRKIPIVV